MRSIWSLPFAMAFVFAIADYNLAYAVPVSPLSAVAPASDIQLARAGGGRGGHGGAVHRGGAAVHRGGAAVHRGGTAVRRGGAVAVHRGGTAVRRGGAVAVRRGGAVAVRHRVGGRYYGGTWYGPGRHYWRGRWYAYGVGSCWRSTPIGYVWICG
jgi:hypothetical protein